MKKNIYIILAILFVAGIAALGEFVPRVDSPAAEGNGEKKNENPARIANPASEQCVSLGYSLEMRKDEWGGEFGVCVFPDGTSCGEWEFFRGECGAQWGNRPDFMKDPVVPPAPGGAERENEYKGCPEWVNCMPGPDLPPNHCVIPPGCEGYTQKAY